MILDEDYDFKHCVEWRDLRRRLLFQRNIYSHSVDSEDQKIIPSYPFKWWFSLLYENSFPRNFTINSNICYMVKNRMRSAQSAAPTLTSTKTALNYLHQPDFNKVQLITDWILTGQWQCNQTRAAHQYCLKDDKTLWKSDVHSIIHHIL